MFGTLRLALAVMVVLSHTNGNFGAVNIGVIAVVVFFLISGYAMTGLLQTRFAAPGAAPAFYLERFVRLAPQYYFWLPIAMIETLYLGWSPVDTAGFIPYGLFAYLTVVPLGVQGYFGIVGTYIMVQAATLGIEITFYVIAPWLVGTRWLSWPAASACLGIFVATELNLLPPALFTYYTSPGPLILFLLGSFLYRQDWTSLAVFTTAAVVVLTCGLSQPYDKEFLIGIMLGLPVLAVLKGRAATLWDTRLGSASYGCYLAHPIIIVALKHALGAPAAAVPPVLRAVIVVLACLAGYGGYILVEKPTVAFRRRLKAGPGAGIAGGRGPAGPGRRGGPVHDL